MRWPHGRIGSTDPGGHRGLPYGKPAMAYSTRRWSQVNQDRCFLMKLLPYCRMMSATSKGGWFIAFAASGSA